MCGTFYMLELEHSLGGGQRTDSAWSAIESSSVVDPEPGSFTITWRLMRFSWRHAGEAEIAEERGSAPRWWSATRLNGRSRVATNSVSSLRRENRSEISHTYLLRYTNLIFTFHYNIVYKFAATRFLTLFQRSFNADEAGNWGAFSRSRRYRAANVRLFRWRVFFVDGNCLSTRRNPRDVSR